jgi:hypothetical protein
MCRYEEILRPGLDNLEWVTTHKMLYLSTNLKPSKYGVEQLTVTGVIVNRYASLNEVSTHI